MRGVTGIGVTVCVLLHCLLLIYVIGSIRTELEHFLSSVYEHPQGGVFEMQGDMIINADIITGRKVTIYTNGYQVRIEHNIDGDSNVDIDNFGNDAAWGSVDKEKMLTMEGNGKNRPLVYMNTGASTFGLRIHSTEGTALGITDGEGLYAKYTDKESYISTEGENTIGVLSKNPYAEVKSQIPLSKWLGRKDSYTTIQLNLYSQLHLVLHTSFSTSMMKVTAGYYHTHYKGRWIQQRTKTNI